MKHLYLILFIYLLPIGLSAQVISFEQIPALPPAPTSITNFACVARGDIIYTDVDNDNDMDVFVTGSTTNGGRISQLYRNTGNGIFTEIYNSNITGMHASNAAFADVDGDGDQDLLMCGEISNFPSTRLYYNDGSGTFSNAPNYFTAVSQGSISFSDIDNDNDMDVLISGRSNSSNTRISKLYKNNGSGAFSVVSNTPFDGMYLSEVIFADVDGDNDEDVLMAGSNDNYITVTKLYKNNGLGNFSLVSGTNFTAVRYGSIAFADVDGDNDLDVVINGDPPSSAMSTKLYTNDGTGIFSEVTGTPFTGLFDGKVAFADIDNDADQDLIISGSPISFGSGVTELYTNNGSGVFTLNTNSALADVSSSEIAFVDLDNDLDQDLIIGGYTYNNNDYLCVTVSYANDGNGVFSEITGSSLADVHLSSVVFGDIDSDNDEDILIAGEDKLGNTFTGLYNNNGMGNYTALNAAPFDNVRYSSIAFADIDNDNDKDVLVTGQNNFAQRIAKLYTNDGNGVYTLVSGTPFDGVFSGDIAFADIDNDNDQDVLITGYNSTNQKIAKLYTNNGTGIFTLVSGTPFEGAYRSAIEFSDIDNDNDQDVLITGYGASNQRIAQLYSNNGSGSFTLVSGTPFTGVRSGDIAFADIDNDNDQDLMITGEYSNGQPLTELFHNDGTGNFSLASGTSFPDLDSSAIVFEDVDNDGDLDLLITGKNQQDLCFTRLYANDGAGNFSYAWTADIVDVKSGDVAFGHINNDNYIDLLITGYGDQGPVTRIYLNKTCYENASIDSIVACDSLVWINGITYYADNTTALHVLTNAGGCDSTVTLNLNIIDGATGLDSYTACDSFTWIDGNTYYNSNSTATKTLNSGCVVTLDLTIINSNGSIDNIVACDSLTWTNGITYYGSNSTAKDTLVNSSGCDSIVTLNLYIPTSLSSTDTRTVCDNLVWIDGITYYNDNHTATHTTTSYFGCDSIITLDLTVLNSTQSTDVQVVCDSLLWIDGNSYYSNNTSASYVISGGATSGCDSTIYLDLTVHQVDTSITTYDSLLVTNQTNATFQWVNCDDNYAAIPNQTNATFNTLSFGNYAVIINYNGCIDTSACYTFISTYVSTAQQVLLNETTVYPNPTNGLVNLALGDLKNVSLKIYNSQAQIVYQIDNISTPIFPFKLDQPAGVYFIELNNNSEKSYLKLIIE
ncbi:hypothetical protein DNU06_09495 [Putridiphycobacter roseus]|uniref:Secretion system C-terminal sorting domain-containing protein n=1 Tax=Putridiphycobacter roseus TaxID=2219161 RepID=A0A2W1NC94_9FLAO|nr:FG-GAP-like repeat-containing protein [Putridiphycobacter roseus]PZE16975.1 hypothetical protein DNU06_09495 [Putridiphycobacter roseus]